MHAMWCCKLHNFAIKFIFKMLDVDQLAFGQCSGFNKVYWPWAGLPGAMQRLGCNGDKQC